MVLFDVSDREAKCVLLRELAEQAKGLANHALQTAVDRVKVLSDGLATELEKAANLISNLHHETKILSRLNQNNAELLLNPRGMTAVHEAGHAVLCWRSPTVLRIDSAKLHNKGGTVWRENTRIPTNVSRWYDIAISLAGIAAELEFGTTFSPTACKKDLLTAASRAKAMVAEGYDLSSCPWKQDENVKAIDVGSVLKPRPPDQETAILRRCFQHARYILRLNEEGLLQLSKEILRQEKLTHDEIIEVLGPRPFNEKMIF